MKNKTKDRLPTQYVEMRKWYCNYIKGCNKFAYYHVCTRNKHLYICPEHLNQYLGYIKV
jgi:hypothetical protein